MASNIVTKAGDVLVTKSGDSLEYLSFVNKVVYGGNTIIDISDTSATASDVALGKKFYMANGAPAVGTATSGGGTAAVTVTNEVLPDGGVAKHITAVDISSDTVDAAHLALGYTAHDHSGVAITGTMSGGGGSGGSTWVRPAAWPDYDQLDISNEECMFFTYGHAATSPMDFISFSVTCTGGYTVERGYLVNGIWTVDTTTAVNSGVTFFETLPTDRDYVCYKAYPTTSGNHVTNISMMPPTTYNGYSSNVANFNQSQPCLERYGNLPYCKQFVTWSNRFLQAETELSVSSVTNMSNMFSSCNSLQSLDVSDWDTSSVANMSYMFYNCNGLQSLDVSDWDTSSVTSMNNMFYNCNSLHSLDVSNWNTSRVTSMSNMFYNCNGLQSLDVSDWDTSSVANMSYMFSSCNSLQSLDVSNWNTSSVANMSNMFYNCAGLYSLDVSGWDTSSVTNMSNMFSSCNSLQSLDVSDWNTSRVTSMSNMFYNCNSLHSLDVSGWDTSSVTSMSNMFSSCYSLQSLDISDWDVSHVTGMGSMFSSCYSLQSLDVSDWDTSSVTSMNNMFSSCNSLQSLDVSGWDTSSVTAMNNMFQYCYSLQAIRFTNLSQVYSSMFSACYVVTAFIFDVSSVPALAATNAFSNNNFANGQRILFPASLVDTAKAAANWSTYASYIEAISE